MVYGVAGLLPFFFFNDTATTEIYTLSLHDALPICLKPCPSSAGACSRLLAPSWFRDRKSTRLNSSHLVISYAVFCLKKKEGARTQLSTSRLKNAVVSERAHGRRATPSVCSLDVPPGPAHHTIESELCISFFF